MEKFYKRFYQGVMLFCRLLLVVEIIITSIVVVGRYFFSKTPTWSEEIILTCMIYMALTSAAMALHRNAHIRMTAFDNMLPPVLVNILDLLADAVVIVFAFIMVVEGWQYAASAKGYYSSIPTLSKFWLFFPVPLAGVIMLIFEVDIVAKHIKAFDKGGEAQ